MALNTNWRALGATYYTSGRDGDDANIGNESNPFATIGKYVSLMSNNGVTLSLRNGAVYNEGGFDVTAVGIYSGKGIKLLGDGFSVVDGSGFFPFLRGSVTQGFNFSFDNITLFNINTLTAGQTGFRSTSYENCKIFDSVNVDLGAESKNNLFVRTSINQIYSGIAQTYFRNTFADCQINILGIRSSVNIDGHDFLNCAFDSGTSINNNGGTVSYSLSNCAFESGFVLDGTDLKNFILNGDSSNISTEYTDGEKFSGTITVGSKTITFTNCFWTDDMGFNASTKDVYTLSNSPQSKLLNGFNVIGAFGLGVFIDSANQCFDPVNSGVSIDANITRNLVTGNFDINTSAGGLVRSTDDPTKAIILPFSTSISEFVEFSLQGFNFFNGEWVDDDNYNDPTNLEVRLTYKVSVYDEIGLTWSAFKEYEINQALQNDSGGLGNGNVDADMSALGDVIGRVFRVEFFLRDNGI